MMGDFPPSASIYKIGGFSKYGGGGGGGGGGMDLFETCHENTVYSSQASLFVPT